MALNPVQFASTVIGQFLRYQLTAFPITDDDLGQQAENLLRGAVSTPLVKGPYLSLSKSFRFGPKLQDLADAGTIHPALAGIAEYPSLYAHQHHVLRAVQEGKHALVSAGTGSGKTEAFLYPIIDHCLRARDAGEPEGIAAILVYPMNALAVDQLDRLRHLLAGTGVSFGLYFGGTPADDSKLGGHKRLGQGQGREAYAKALASSREGQDLIIHPWEERVTEAEMREHPPRILLTNIHQLEVLMTRTRDMSMFRDAPLRFLVFDEAHTYGGVGGAETACLIRRLRAFCGRGPDEVICIGTSATLVDPETGEESGAQFAERFFGVDAQRVALVGEEYEDVPWPEERRLPTSPTVNAVDLLSETVDAIEAQDAGSIRGCYRSLTGEELPESGDIFADLHRGMQGNELAYQLSTLGEATELGRAVEVVWAALGRAPDASEQAQAEVLCTLALGAAARVDGNPLMRPKLHYFVKGLEGAVVALEPAAEGGEARPRLYLSAADAHEAAPERQPTAHLPLYVCSACGQHYFRGWYADLEWEDGKPRGGQAEGTNTVWTPVGEGSGTPATFTERFIAEASDEESDATESLDRKRVSLALCRHCGALHRNPSDRCAHDPCRREDALVPVQVVTHLQDDGTLRTCPSCGEKARGFGAIKREPIRPLRATHVADVHILAQDMINAAAEGHQRLICFADNRQDAAFQAGWMKDHSRRYRLRHLIYSYLQESGEPKAVGDVVGYLEERFLADRALGEALAPAVFAVYSEETYGKKLGESLRYYLHIQLLMELATSFRQRDSLETWGVMRADYGVIGPEDPFVVEWSERLRLASSELALGIECLLDIHRRNRLVWHQKAPIFARYWREGDEDVLRGYLPYLGFPPKGLKLRKEGQEAYSVALIPRRGQTSTMGFVSKWWPDADRPEPGVVTGFIEALWKQLTQGWRVLKPVKLVGSNEKRLPGSEGCYQIDAGRIGLVAQRAKYRCATCRRMHPRPTPRMVCTAYQCSGRLEAVEVSEDDYNVHQLLQPFSMVLPEEHTAQVPASKREEIERAFKDPEGQVNCLVATPTLEMGVDIGALDMVLMRNMPPQASNYWQRAGRAGREHRMAVIFTYCRRSIHDGYFFEEPTRMLGGAIAPPRFNLKNVVMLRKHMHAALLSELLAHSAGRGRRGEVSEADREELRGALEEAFPMFIREYLFHPDNQFRDEPLLVGAIGTAMERHRDALLETLSALFHEPWPEEARAEVEPSELAGCVDEVPADLQEVVNRLFRRMRWAVSTRQSLQERESKGLLDADQIRVRQRCESYLRGLSTKELRNYTLTVLAQEGYLPGYGRYDGGIVAVVPASRGGPGFTESYQLSRAPAIAIREFAPGNLIYANGARHRVAVYQVPVGEQTALEDTFIVDFERGRIVEASAQAEVAYADGDEKRITGIPICDCNLAFIASISDTEDHRFQAPAGVLGYLHQVHGGGQAYELGEGLGLRHMKGQRLRLVNVGPADRAKRGEFGFPICIVCGAVRTPYASGAELTRFEEQHQKSCGTKPEWRGIAADAVVDGFEIGPFEERSDAVNLVEGLRIGAEQLLEMERGDLEYITVARGDAVLAFLYDPMPGGSGLLSQMLERWRAICDVGRSILSGCRGACADSCYECMRTYFNLPQHALLDRGRACALLESAAESLVQQYEIPPSLGAAAAEGHAHQANAERLASTLVEKGFPAPDQEQRVEIGPPYGATAPDLSYEDPGGLYRIAIYLDGLSEGIHGNPVRAQQDKIIRGQLEAAGWDVVVIASSELDDPAVLNRHLRRIAQLLMDKELLRSVSQP